MPLFLLSADISDLTQAATEDISLDGFFCYTNVLFAPGERVSFMLLFPEVTRDSHIAKATYLHGIAEVTRVSLGRAHLKFGIGCRLMTYRVLSHRDLLKAEDILNAMSEDGPFLAQTATHSNLGV